MIEEMNFDENFPSSSVAMNWLKKKGYILDFNLKEEFLYCIENDVCLKPEDFHIDKVFRFEGATNPADEEVVYAVSSLDGKYKGIVFNAYGVYGDRLSNEMIRKLSWRGSGN